MQIVLDPVFLMEARRRLGRFRRQIGNVIAAADLERHQVIHLVAVTGVVGNPVLGVHRAANV